MTWEAVAVVLAAIAGQAFWISRALDRLDHAVRDLEVDVEALRDDVLRDHGERIARLEERTGAA